MSQEAELFTPERISTLAQSIHSKLSQSISSISTVNSDLRLLAFNAKIQAAKAGAAGAGFGIVANEIKEMVSKTREITDDLESHVGHAIGELTSLNQLLGTQVRGRRLAQVAGSCMDIVDRNLYERSCDVRWWATEGAVVEALDRPCQETAARASARMATILRSYTVYHDLILCDLSGRVACNGRPGIFQCAGADLSNTKWFQEARYSANGEQFGFQGPCRSMLAGGKPSLVYSCAVRAAGAVEGTPLGVIGVVFDWTNLGQVVVERAQAMLQAECEHPLHVLLCLPSGELVAASPGACAPSPAGLHELISNPERFTVSSSLFDKDCLCAFAPSVGYETYQTGWMAIVAEEHPRKPR